MEIWLADPLFGGTVQSGRHLIELLAAFGLTAIVGLERTIQGKVAGLRTQTSVGASSAQTMVLDPSRVATQVISGIGCLGAGRRRRA